MNEVLRRSAQIHITDEQAPAVLDEDWRKHERRPATVLLATAQLRKGHVERGTAVHAPGVLERLPAIVLVREREECQRHVAESQAARDGSQPVAGHAVGAERILARAQRRDPERCPDHPTRPPRDEPCGRAKAVEVVESLEDPRGPDRRSDPPAARADQHERARVARLLDGPSQIDQLASRAVRGRRIGRWFRVPIAERPDAHLVRIAAAREE